MSCSKNVKNSEQRIEQTTESEKTIFISYSEGGAFDIYEHGDVYGYRLNIDFKGKFTVYQRIYSDTSSTPEIVEEPLQRGTLDQDTLNQIKQKLSDSSFFDYPSVLPTGSPDETNLRKPSETVKIAARRISTDSLKTVRAQMGGDPNFYPKHFFELHDLLTKIMNNLL